MDIPDAIIEQLRRENAELRAQLAAALEQNRQLQERLDQAERASARQAAPFRRRDSQKVPDDAKKRPGRRPGHRGARRSIPCHVDAHVEVPLGSCPGCGGPVTAPQPIVQWIEEVPQVRPHVTRLVTYRGFCAACGQVHSTHPLQTSRATGAAQVQLGPRARALAISLNKEFGLTMRKACRVLKHLAGLTLSPGGLALAAQRTAQRVQLCFDSLVLDVRAAASVFIDETSWYVAAPGHWLWTFTTADTTVYHVDAHRSRQVVLDMLGPKFTGIVVSDCLASYEALPYRMHKCIAHHQKAIAQARDRPDTLEKDYLRQWKLLFTMVSVLWRFRATLGEAEFARQRGHLEGWLDRLLAMERTQAGDVAIQKRIGKRRDVVLGCLDDPAAVPTYNRAERALRPAVIARKVSCGNKTEQGQVTWECLTSLATTCQQRGHDFVSWLAGCLPLDAPVISVPRPNPTR
jgi:transposase